MIIVDSWKYMTFFFSYKNECILKILFSTNSWWVGSNFLIVSSIIASCEYLVEKNCKKFLCSIPRINSDNSFKSKNYSNDPLFSQYELFGTLVKKKTCKQHPFMTRLDLISVYALISPTLAKEMCHNPVEKKF